MPGEAVTALLQEHVVAAMIKQARLRDAVGEDAEGWSADVTAGRLTLGRRDFAIEPVGTESHNNDTFVWAWANPSMTDLEMPGALTVKALGEERGIGPLADDGEIPLEELDGFTACVVTVGLAGLDAYYLAPYERDGEGVFALGIRDKRLLVGPPTALSLASTFTNLLMGAPPFSHRRAFAHYLARPLGAVSAEVSGGGVVLRAADGPVTVRLDGEGRIGQVTADVPPRG